MKATTEAKLPPDFDVSGGGTLYILTPLTAAAKEWCNDHLPEDAQRWCNGYAVEHRYIGDIVAGIQADGYRVR